MDFPQIFARAFNTPLLVHPAKAQAFVSGFGPRLLGGTPEIVGGTEQPPEGAYRTVKPFASLLDQRLVARLRENGAKGYIVRDGIAVIPVTGVLVHRGDWIGNSSGQTSYEGLEAQLRMAADDAEVRGIALELDSFGGQVAGCFGLAKLIREIGARKPIWAFVAEHAFSAAYAIASQATRIILPATGGVGSIGVIMLHADFSAQLEAEGIKVTIISAGTHKGEGNPYEPLPADVLARFQGEAEDLRGMFAEHVGAGRGRRLDAAGALATEAASYLGSEAVEAGLADAVAEPRDAFEDFAAEIRGTVPAGLSRQRLSSQKETTMHDNQNQPADAPDETGAAPTAAAAPAAPADQAGASERKRIAAIINSPEAEGRAGLARHLAFETDLEAEAAEGILKASAKEASGGSLAEAMAGDDTDLDSPAADAAKGPRLSDRAKSRFAA